MSKFFFYSLTLHVIVGFVTWLDLPAFWRKQPVITEIPIMVDLSDVVISGITNLPAELEEETEPEPEPEESEYIPAVPEEQLPEIEFEPVIIPQETKLEEYTPELEFEEVKPEAVSLVEKKEEPKKEPEPKRVAVPSPPSHKPASPQAEKPKKPKKPKKKKEVNPLESLLASVDGMKKNFKKRAPDAVGTSKKRKGGIKGGTGGILGGALTISEKDAIALRIKQNWNLDVGAIGIENMLIEIRVYLMPDGTVKKVQILDKNRYQSDASFRSIAESARRAVYMCSPFEVPQEKYEMWKTMLLRFNPMDGGVS